jgi:hypothetical protein
VTDRDRPTGSASAAPACPKCKSVQLRLLSSPDGEPYVLCRDCGFEFHPDAPAGRRPRGVPPLKVVLASVVFASPLRPEAPRIADTLFRQFAPEDVRCFLDEITAALVDPTRQLRALYDLPHSEADVRGFLDLVAARLDAKLHGEA